MAVETGVEQCSPEVVKVEAKKTAKKELKVEPVYTLRARDDPLLALEQQGMCSPPRLSVVSVIIISTNMNYGRYRY